jgi:hypothetical protein
MIRGQAPAILIEVPLEAAPRVLLNCMNSSEEDRLTDWIRAHDGLAELVARAIELAEEARAA